MNHVIIVVSHKRICACFLVLLSYTIQFFGCFLPQNALRVIVITKLSTIRGLIWTVIGWTAYKEFYHYASEDPDDPAEIPITNIWVGFMAAYLEVLIVWKWRDNGFAPYENTLNPVVLVLWVVCMGGLFLRYVYVLYFPNKYRKPQPQASVVRRKSTSGKIKRD